jgi:hypothetical protein
LFPLYSPSRFPFSSGRGNFYCFPQARRPRWGGSYNRLLIMRETA